MPLTQPFVDLSAQAPRCASPDDVVHTLRDAGTLLRTTDTPIPTPDEAAQWYSGVVRSVLASPAGAALRGGSVAPTGALGRDEFLPGMTLCWVRRGRADTSELSRVFAAAGIPSSPSDGDPVDLIDAGHFRPDGPDRILLERAVEKRDDELIPGIARWAAGARAAARTRTPDRLVAGVAGGLLSGEEEAILAGEWRAGLGRRLAQWRNEDDRGDDSPPEVVDVARRIAERNNISVATEGEWS